MKSFRQISVFLLSLCMIGLLSSPVLMLAQRTQASLQGTVTDPSSSLIPNAQIELINVHTGAVRHTVSSSTGSFIFPDVEPGDYEIDTSAAGMKPEKRTGITVTTGVVNQVTIQLQVGNSQESVTVNAGIQMVNTSDATVSTLISDKQVQTMPLDVRSFSSLVKLQPAVTPGGIGNSESSPNTDTGGFVAGQRSFDEAYTVDGGNVMSPTWPQPVWAVTANGGISLDAVREFRIFTSNKPADGGGKAGALIAITTKSGTERFHGSAFEYLRNTVLDAKNYFDTTRLPYHQNQFGGSLGGPILRRDQLYFFGSYEGFRSRQPLGMQVTVPTPLLYAAIPSGASHGYLREIMENTFPAPNSGYDASLPTATANTTYDNGNTRNMGLGRVDWQASKSNQLTLRYMQVAGHSGYGATTASGITTGNVGQDWTGDNALIRLTTTLSSTLVNDAHLDYDRSTTAFLGETPPAALTALGFAADATSPDGVPTISFSGTGLPSDGPPSWLPDLRRENSYEVADSLTWVHGKHSLTFGGQYLRQQDNAIAIGNIRPSATFQCLGSGFDTGGCEDVGASLTSGIFLSQSQAQLLGEDNGVRGYRVGEGAVFIHDNWKLSPRLALDLGLRWTYATPFTEAHGRLNNLYIGNSEKEAVTLSNVANAALVTSGSGSDSLPYSQNVYTEFAPNVGINWDAYGNGKTVISAGFSMAYERPFMNYLQGASTNVPFVEATTLNKMPFGTTGGSDASLSGTPSLTTENPASVIPYVYYYNLTLQQALSGNTTLQIGYIGNKGTHLYTDLTLNKGGSYTGVRPNTTYSTINQVGTDGASSYNGLAVQLQRRYERGVSLSVAYTYAKALDTASAANFGGADFPVDEDNRAGEWGPSIFNVKHVLTGNAVYRLPFGRDGLVGRCSHGVVCNAISGWQASTIFSLHTGAAFEVSSGGDNNGDGVYNDRAYQIESSLSLLHNRSGLSKTQWLNPAAIGQEITANTSGTMLGRNSFVGPKYTNFDVEMRKETKLSEQLNLIFIAQGFNIANVTNFGLPNATVTGSNFGAIQTTAVNGGSRVFQFALRLEF